MKLTSNKWWLRCDDVAQKEQLFEHAESVGLPIEPEHRSNYHLIIGIGALSGKLMAMHSLNWDEGERVDEDWFYSMCDDYAAQKEAVA